MNIQCQYHVKQWRKIEVVKMKNIVRNKPEFPVFSVSEQRARHSK